jgi:hypothetical protein
MATYDQLKDALMQQLAERGTLDVLSAGLQAELYTLFAASGPAGGTSSTSSNNNTSIHRASSPTTQALHDLIIEYLHASGLRASLSVFVQETGVAMPGHPHHRADASGPLVRERKDLQRQWPGLSHVPSDV